MEVLGTFTCIVGAIFFWMLASTIRTTRKIKDIIHRQVLITGEKIVGIGNHKICLVIAVVSSIV